VVNAAFCRFSRFRRVPRVATTINKFSGALTILRARKACQYEEICTLEVRGQKNMTGDKRWVVRWQRKRSATVSVRAGGGIQAGFRDAQTINGLISHDVRSDYIVHIICRNSAVPNGFGINYDGWTMLTLVEAAGLIGAYLAL
jgi:hypothetical protein